MLREARHEEEHAAAALSSSVMPRELRAACLVPLSLKGAATPREVPSSVISAIVVSNHGARLNKAQRRAHNSFNTIPSRASLHRLEANQHPKALQRLRFLSHDVEYNNPPGSLDMHHAGAWLH